MKRGNKRATYQEFKRAKELFNQGKNYEEIGKILNRDRTTIKFWINKKNKQKEKGWSSNLLEFYEEENSQKEEKNNMEIGNNRIEQEKAEEELKEEKNEEELKEEKRKEVRMAEGRCIICGKEKRDAKWKMTNFCSLICFEEDYSRKTHHRKLLIFKNKYRYI